MKVLQLCPKPLIPPFDGGKIAMVDMAEGLIGEGCELVQLMIHTPAHPLKSETLKDKPNRFFTVFVNTKIRLIPALWNLLIGNSYNLSRFNDKAYHKKLEELLLADQFDIIQGESIYTLTDIERIRGNSKSKIILRAHNVEYKIWQRLSKTDANFLKRFYFKILAKQLKKKEIAICNQVDGLVVMSEQDKEILQADGVIKPIKVIGIGSHIEPPEEHWDQVSEKKIFHLGSMNWLPNVEGVKWFIDNVWPLVQFKMPEIRLFLAGYEIEKVFPDGPKDNVKIVQAVDAREFMLQSGIMIVPLLSGSGIRVKIIEGLSLGKVIVTTNVGVEGISAEDGKEILIADNPKEFADKILVCFSNPSFAEEISKNALKFAKINFDYTLFSRQLIDFYHKMLLS